MEEYKELIEELNDIYGDNEYKLHSRISEFPRAVQEACGKAADAIEKLSKGLAALNRTVQQGRLNSTSIDSLDLTVRTYSCLKRHGIDTVGQLMALDDERLCRVRNLGQNGIKEICQKLEKFTGKETEIDG